MVEDEFVFRPCLEFFGVNNLVFQGARGGGHMDLFSRPLHNHFLFARHEFYLSFFQGYLGIATPVINVESRAEYLYFDVAGVYDETLVIRFPCDVEERLARYPYFSVVSRKPWAWHTNR